MILWIKVSNRSREDRRHTNLKCQIDAVTEMHSLQARGVVLATHKHTTGISADPWAIRRLGESKYRVVSDGAALHQTNTLEFREQSQSLNRLVRQVCAAAQVDVPDSIAVLDQLLNTLICDLPAVAQMHVMEVLAEL